jgi:hypothetical protein
LLITGVFFMVLESIAIKYAKVLREVYKSSVTMTFKA